MPKLSPQSLLSIPHSFDLLTKLGQDSIWKYFALCMETPRPSSKLDLMRSKIRAVGERLNCTVVEDAAGNLVIRKPASKGFETAPAVALQCHMDMVTSKNEGVDHDFDKDPIRPKLDGEWLKAESTTLGADDGIGVAACLALLEVETDEQAAADPATAIAAVADSKGNPTEFNAWTSKKDGRRFVHPPLELLFTADEETTMSGATNIDPTLLQSRLMINVDSEEEGAICIGCAGGFEKTTLLPVEWQVLASAPSSDIALLSVQLKGLLGGHSGAQIHERLGNGLQLLAAVLLHAAAKLPADSVFSLCAYVGGTAVNAIPRECRSIVAVHSKDLDLVTKLFAEGFEAVVRGAYSVKEEPNAELVVTHLAHSPENWAKTTPRPLLDAESGQGTEKESDAAPAPTRTDSIHGLSRKSSSLALEYIVSLPHKVVRMSADVPDLVESSVAFTIVQLTDTGLHCHLFARSSNDDHMVEMAADFDREFSAHWWTSRGFQHSEVVRGGKQVAFGPSETLNMFPGWQPNIKSISLAGVLQAHVDELNVQPKVFAVHAGLECGFWQRTFPGMDCVSIGPEVAAAHSPDERLLVRSVPKFMHLLAASLDILARRGG